MQILKKILDKITFTFLMLAPGALLAQGDEDYGLSETARSAKLPGAESNRQLPEIVGLIINALLGVIGTILVVLIIYGGFLWMTAAGEDEKVNKAKEIIKNAVIGLIVIFLAYGIASFVVRALVTAAQ